ncbi:MAG: hypothetical protein C0601_01705, partial [Candidatus Muiribacterium halophilum]
MLKYFTLLADKIIYDLLNLKEGTKLASSSHFFIEDTTKIFFLMTIMIYIISFIRAGLDSEVVKDKLEGKHPFLGYLSGAVLGSITPFCSCSSIPLFIAFTKAKIPTGYTMSFLITSPMINEVAVVLLWGMLGWKLTVMYIVSGILSGIIGGYFFDIIKSERFIKDLSEENAKIEKEIQGEITIKKRHEYALVEVIGIVKSLWKWIIIGVGVGALFHGYLPEKFISDIFSKKSWWTVPGVVLMGIPLYSSATAVIPGIKALIMKGLPYGTAIAFMMSTVAASTPEFVMLSKVMEKRMLVIFFFVLLFFFTTTGIIINL